MSGTLALASAIADMDEGTLRSLVRRRPPNVPSNVADPIGLATELLRTDSLTRAITPLRRDQLAALLRISTTEALPSDETDETGANSTNNTSSANAASDARDTATRDELMHFGLLGKRGTDLVALPEVTTVLLNGLDTAGIAPSTLYDAPLADAPRDPEPETHTWYAAALTAVGQGSEILRALGDNPGHLNRSGSIAVATVRALSELTSVETDATALMLTAVERAGLLRAEPTRQRLSAGTHAEEWLTLSRSERWLVLARSALDAMSEPLRTALSATGANLAAAAAALPGMFPLLPKAETERATAFVTAMDHLGVTVQGTLSAPARALISGDLAGARTVLSTEMPPAAPGVYVQPDLSVVIPGTLTPSDEAAIAALSRPEHIGVATTRRVSESSLAESIERGADARAVRELFTRLSLTGIPQPLDYLLSSLAERSESIKVSAYRCNDVRSHIAVPRPELGATILVDRSLQHLQLMRSVEDHNVLYSRLRPELTVAALKSAHYPASLASPQDLPDQPGLQDLPGLPERQDLPDRPEQQGDAQPGEATFAAIPGESSSNEELPSVLEDLVQRVFLAARSEPGTADFTRLLELAIRDRGTVRVTAEARGQTHVFTLLPVSLKSGRLRATDAAAGMERTLPVSMISAVETL